VSSLCPGRILNGDRARKKGGLSTSQMPTGGDGPLSHGKRNVLIRTDERRALTQEVWRPKGGRNPFGSKRGGQMRHVDMERNRDMQKKCLRIMT